MATDDRVEELLERLADAAFFGFLSRRDVLAILKGSRGVRARRGDSLLRTGEDAAVTLLAGTASVQSLSYDGRMVITNILGPGSTWGLAKTLGRPASAAEVRALCDVEAVVLPGPLLRARVAERHPIARACLSTVAGQLAAIHDETALFMYSSTTQRVVHRLLELAERWGEPDRADPNRVRIRLPLSQDELAAWAHASREAVAKTLHDLRGAGVVRTGRLRFDILDLAALRTRDSVAGQDPILPSSFTA
jgi:CRP/FNR family transcriptional regulator, cyclic AMP receptor protein